MPILTKQVLVAARRSIKATLAPFEREVPAIFRDGTNPRRACWRKCYVKAWEYLAGLDTRGAADGAVLVHGTICGWIDHAWVELPCGLVFDGVLQRFYDRDGYYVTRQAEKLCEYTWREAARVSLVARHFGPWTDDDRVRCAAEMPA